MKETSYQDKTGQSNQQVPTTWLYCFSSDRRSGYRPR